MRPAPTIVWFRHDLRLDDHPALHAAVHRGGPVIPVYIWAPQEEGDWVPGGASCWWLQQALASLDTALRQRGSRLVLRQGESLPTLMALARDTGAAAVLWNRRYEPAVVERDATIACALQPPSRSVRRRARSRLRRMPGRPAARPAPNAAADPMATRTRSRVNLKTYPEQLERFLAQYMEAVYRQWAGLDEEMGLAAIYAEHAGLFSAAAIDALRERSAKDDESGREARELLALAVQQHAAAAVADLTERIEVAEAQAVIIWQGERIPYRQVPNRAADIANRIARNALYDSYLEAVEAINPLREEKLAAVREAVRGLGYADVPAMVAATAGFDPDALAAEMRLFLAESETVYFAALRRFLAEIDIEQGDASKVDLDHVIRGEGWDRWFEAHRMLPAFRATLNGLGIDIDAQPSILLDIEPRPQKSARAFCAAVNVPNDVRLVMQPRGGWDDYAALLHEGGHAEHFAHVEPGLPVPWRLLGDNSLTEGYGLLFERLVGEPAWLRHIIGMPDDEAAGFADFSAFWYLHLLRGGGASLIYELNLHRGEDLAIAREEYAGMLGLTLGVRFPQEQYLEIDDNLYVARYMRAAMVAGSLSAWLQTSGGEMWWTSRDSGAALRRSWARGQEWNAQDVVAHLGYDHLDWRPVLRQIRTLLIGEMSGYGGPNITTRAGTRKV